MPARLAMNIVSKDINSTFAVDKIVLAMELAITKVDFLAGKVKKKLASQARQVQG